MPAPFLHPITEAPRDGSAFRAVVNGERVTVRRLNGLWCCERRSAPDTLDLYEVLALAAAELRCVADTIYAARRPTEEMLAAARAVGIRAVETIDEWRSRP